LYGNYLQLLFRATKHQTEHHNHHVLLALDRYVQAKISRIIRKEQDSDYWFFTGKYGRQPASRVLAIESINCPLIPKSQSLIDVLETNIFEGLTSR
jgi:hypothetical protein